MTSVKHVLASSGLTGLLGAVAFAGPASADLKAICAVGGTLKAHTTKPAFKKYAQLVGGHGTYRFEHVVAGCMDMGKSKAPGPAHVGRVDATGAFKQEIAIKDDPTQTPIQTPCGYGKIIGVVTQQELAAKFRALLGRKFAIQLGPAIGNGAFFWHHLGPVSKSTDVPKLFRSSREGEFGKPGAKPYRYAGDIQLGLSGSNEKEPLEDFAKRVEPGMAADKCTKTFDINGVVLVHEDNSN